MNILALDTTTKKATVAIKTDSKLYIECIDNEITHSEKLLPLIDNTLDKANITIQDIDLLACTLGPGSFTGVRIGIATLKAIAKVINKEIFGITSLEILALNALKKVSIKSNYDYILSLIDAKNDRAYFSLFKLENGKLSEMDSGNDYIQTILSSHLTKDKLLICKDDVLLLDNIALPSNTEIITTDLDLSIVFDMDLSENLYNYLNLDAMYYRKSEAERTKEGE